MYAISANDLKRKGVSAFAKHHETVVTIRGKACFVALDIDTYEELRRTELEMALIEAKNDIKKGDYVVESVAKHIKRIKKMAGK